ncbi:ligase [Nostocoides sp. F2B08]|nr:ligase [Tetrasphaera sp. F2B08]
MAARRDLAADGVRIAEYALGEVERRLVAAPAAGSRVTITAYEPLPVEPDMSALLRAAYDRGMRVLVPLTLTDLDLDWREWSPSGSGAPLGKDAVAEVSVAFVPGLAVDASGTRLGQGGGCYDKALPRVRSGAPVICVLHPEEDLTEPALPREVHDVVVDAVLTADGIRSIPHRPSLDR